jgi:Tfp pilus assembly protein PilF
MLAKNATLHAGAALADVYLKRASAHLKAGQPKEAIADVDAAVPLNADDERDYLIRSEAYHALGQEGPARADAEFAKRLRQLRGQRSVLP